ncbi:DSS1/SEM1 family-domain-containing protein [Penicillium hispanicum]|uniref:DSS1/SEM1 family-domain-containing protein n=1 Tax=Penicillium hispanicum TaxID=1080232 RepID=UPI0025418F9C|nr:DSS1/SEM1 family-domain-containing protein [Penicillium hispanicum]KAJ5587715.1 DSS1/SEM1 family-domain-containing protein [Penicillium hispanicum]
MSNSTQTQNKADPSEQPQQQQKPQVLEEDDEFEDFPVEGLFFQLLGSHTYHEASRPALTQSRAADWPQEEAEQSAANGGNEHLWEESWDDDDAAEDFSKQLKEELKKVEASH